MISIENLSKTYGNGHRALENISLDIREGEILALLGPNGAGKTTLISIICGLVKPSAGSVKVAGFDIVDDYRETRSMIGLVPQELALGAFDRVVDTVRFSRGLFGKAADDSFIDSLLGELSLSDKQHTIVNQLSGGMKRRVLIAKALAHQPRVLFLDEPTAGVDVELRKDMWRLVESLREQGVTIILTTHYIEEAEAIADRVGVISAGRLLVLDEKERLMQSLGQKQLLIDIREPINSIPASLGDWHLDIEGEGMRIVYTYDATGERTGITALLNAMSDAGIQLKDLRTRQSSLEDIFVDLVRNAERGASSPSPTPADEAERGA